MSFSSVGLGSGLDVTSMVSKLVELEKRPLTLLQTKAATLNARVSAFSQLKSAISNLQDQVSKLTAAETWNAKSATSSKTDSVTANVTSAAMPTTLHVHVGHLAQGQVVSAAVARSAAQAHGSGELKIQLGRVQAGTQESDPPNFVHSAEAELTINVADKTLSQIADEINQKQMGVTATVLKDAQGERLTFQSQGTGDKAAFHIEGTGDAAAYAFDPANAEANTGMRSSQLAKDAKITVNGVDMFSATNTFTDLAEGVNLTVTKPMEAAETATITVKQDTAAGKTALKNLVESYNSFSKSMATMTAYNPESKEAGTLQGDSTAASLQNALRRLLTGNAGSGTGEFTTLSQMGLEFQKDGTLKINDTKLDAAIAKNDSMLDFWAADREGVDQDGMAVRLKAFTEGLLSSDGMFATKTESLQSQLKRNTTDQERVSMRVASYEKNLLAKYTALDTKMASLTALDSYISQQVTSWNNSSRG